MARFHSTDRGDIPFTAEEEAAWDAMTVTMDAQQAEEARLLYKTYRAAEYPSMLDYLDGIVKGDQAQIQTYIDACLAVKAKYPKTL